MSIEDTDFLRKDAPVLQTRKPRMLAWPSFSRNIHA